MAEGEFAGVFATGKAVEIPVVVVWRVEVGRAAEDRTLWDHPGGPVETLLTAHHQGPRISRQIAGNTLAG